jgi:hypothetical protein
MRLKRTILVALAVLFSSAVIAQTFTKITNDPVTNGIESFGGSWGDYDDDGDLDLFVMTRLPSLNNPNGNNLLYRNNGNGTFVQVLAIPGNVVTDGPTNAGGASWIDIDNDDDLDLFVGSGSGNNRLYLNNGDGSFTKETSSPIVNTVDRTRGHSFADYNNDGNLDLYISTPDNQPGLLFEGAGNGVMTPITTGDIATDTSRTGSCTWGDYDNDGFIDLAVSHTDFGNSIFLYKNDGTGTFTRQTSSVVEMPANFFTGAYGASWVDYDNDQDLDLYQLNGFGRPIRLFDNNGNGTFTENFTSGLDVIFHNNGGQKWGDFDNDGDLDLFTCDFVTNNLFVNNGNGTFTKNTTEAIVNDAVVESFGASWVDFDNDGDLDFFVSNGFGDSGNYFYRNDGNSNHWISVKGLGVTSNKSAIGARVYITATINGSPVTQMREINASTESLAGGGNPRRTHFGLGDATIITELRVEWPASGTIQTFNNVAVDQFIKVKEDDNTIIVCPAAVPDLLPPNPGVIAGKAYNDINNNCVFDAGTDTPIANRLIQATSGPYFALTDFSGDYSFDVVPGTLDIDQPTVATENWELQSCQTSASYNVTVAAGGVVAGNDFSLRPLPPAGPWGIDVTILSTPYLAGPCTAPAILTGPCPGINHRYCITFTNTGTNTIPATATLSVALDPNMTFIGIVGPNPCGFTTGGGSVFNPGAAIPPGGSCSFCIDVAVNPSVTAPPWTTSATGSYNQPGPGATSDTDSATDTEGCPCDPNDKMSTPTGCGPFGNVAQEEELTYKVRFQNIGGTPAIDVVIRDEIDEDLDITSLQILGSSHNITGVQVIPNNALIISFEGINLPDSASDPLGSNGYVIFSLTPKPNLADGTPITNQADIYFDQNEAVITNTVLNTIRDNPEPVAEFESSHSCTSTGLEFDFTYTGGTSDGATFDWDFGPDATPQTSTDENPTGIVFATEGDKVVTLTVTRFGCVSVITYTIGVETVECKNNKVSVCHNGNTICISVNALAAHLAHGDCIGDCGSVIKTDLHQHTIAKEEPASEFELNVYPNPFQNNATISYFVPFGTIAPQIVIHDYTGRIVKEITVESGHGKVEIDGSEINAGIYFYSIVVNGQLQESKKMILTK